MDDVTVHASEWRLSAADIANGGGIATVTLKSGVQLEGRIDKQKSMHDTLHLSTARGWTVVDYAQIAALNGEPSR